MTPKHKNPTLKDYFLTGLLALLPLLISAFVVIFLWRLLGGVIDPVMMRLLALVLPETAVAALAAWGVPTMLGILLLLAVILLAGVLTQKVVGRAMLSFMDVVFKRVPIVSGVYDGVRQVTSAFDPEGQAAFREVVYVRLAPKGALTLGFVTNQLPKSRLHPRGLTAVYVPTNNLYIGMTLLVDPREVEPAGMTVQQGMKTVVSMGLALPENVK